MKSLIAITALAAASTLALSPALAQTHTQTVVHDPVTGTTTTYVYQGKTYPRVKQAWVAPTGWENRAYVVGDSVPEVIYADPTYVIDYERYQLPRHTSDTKWVRVGNDALLIRIGTGGVVERIENFYY